MCSSLGGPELPTWSRRFDFSSPVQRTETTIDNTPFTLISGGKPITIHAKSRYQVQEIVDGTEAIAAVDGGLSKVFKPNVMGPVLSQIAGIAGKFIPGNMKKSQSLTTSGANRFTCSQVHCPRSHKAIRCQCEG